MDSHHDQSTAETEEPKRGRPPFTMTHRRRQILNEIAQAVSRGERVTLASLARRCGLHDYRNARRVMKDLQQMGMIDIQE